MFFIVLIVSIIVLFIVFYILVVQTDVSKNTYGIKPSYSKDTRVLAVVVSYNRQSTLKRCVESILCLPEVTQIVIVDNGTCDKDSMNIMNAISQKHTTVKVDYYQPIKNMKEFDANVQKTLEKHLDETFTHYIVTDADVDVSCAPSDLISVLNAVSTQLNVNAGPELRIDDIPDAYPFKSKVIIDNMYYIDTYKNVYIDDLQVHIPLIHRVIDSTFTLFPVSEKKYKRCNKNVRVGGKYSVRHLDWYLDFSEPETVTAFEAYMHRPHAVEIGGWSSNLAHLANYVTKSKREQINLVEGFIKHTENISPDGVPTYDIFYPLLYWCYSYGFGVNTDKNKAKFYLEGYFNAWSKSLFKENTEKLRIKARDMYKLPI